MTEIILRKSVKILQVHNFYDHQGGEEVVLDLEKELLLKGGAVVERYTDSNRKGLTRFGKLKAIVNYWFSLFSGAKFKRSLLEIKPDVVHIHNTFPKFGQRIIKVASNSGVPVVVTVHNFRYACANGLFLRKGNVCTLCLNGNVLPAIIHKCYRGSYLASLVMGAGICIQKKLNSYSYASKIIVMTEFSKKLLVEYGVDKSVIVVKPHSISPHGVGHQVLPYEKDGANLCFVGRLSKEKGLSEVFESLREVKLDLSLAVIGGGQLADDLEEISQGLNVKFYGWLMHDEVLALLKGSKFLIFPSIWFETFGLVIIEAFSLGVPVIARDIGGTSEIVDNGLNGYLYKSVGELSDILAHCYEMTDDEYEKLSLAAFEKYEKNYTSDINQENLFTTYRSLLP